MWIFYVGELLAMRAARVSEYEADGAAARWGYASALAATYSDLAARKPEAPGRLARLMADHPPLPDRIARLERRRTRGRRAPVATRVRATLPSRGAREDDQDTARREGDLKLAIASDYPFIDILGSMLFFFGFVIWFWLLITVFGDVFRRHDIGGFTKFAWCLFVILVPLLGVLVYMIAEGKEMAQRNVEQAQAAEGGVRRLRPRDRGRAGRRDRARQAAARQRHDHPGRVRPDQAEGARLGERLTDPCRASSGRSRP